MLTQQQCNFLCNIIELIELGISPGNLTTLQLNPLAQNFFLDFRSILIVQPLEPHLLEVQRPLTQGTPHQPTMLWMQRLSCSPAPTCRCSYLELEVVQEHLSTLICFLSEYVCPLKRLAQEPLVYSCDDLHQVLSFTEADLIHFVHPIIVLDLRLLKGGGRETKLSSGAMGIPMDLGWRGGKYIMLFAKSYIYMYTHIYIYLYAEREMCI